MPGFQASSVVSARRHTGYDFYAYFRDVSGQHWVIDARTQRLVNAWTRRKLDMGPAGLDAS